MFDNALFALQSLDGSKILNKIVFDSEYFWNQLHGLPIRYMNKYYGELIGNTIGRVLDMDMDIWTRMILDGGLSYELEWTSTYLNFLHKEEESGLRGRHCGYQQNMRNYLNFVLGLVESFI